MKCHREQVLKVCFKKNHSVEQWFENRIFKSASNDYK